MKKDEYLARKSEIEDDNVVAFAMDLGESPVTLFASPKLEYAAIMRKYDHNLNHEYGVAIGDQNTQTLISWVYTRLTNMQARHIAKQLNVRTKGRFCFLVETLDQEVEIN